MADDQTFRIVLALGMGAILPFGAYHRLRAHASREALDRSQEGLFILLTLRPIILAAMGGVMIFVVNPAWMVWSSVPLPVSLRWTGVGVGLAAGSLLLWTFRTLGTNITDTVVTRRLHTLVTTGPYRLVRHPFYVASALAFLANALTTANWFVALMGGLATILHVVRVRTEEEHLVRRFGDDYRQYMKETGRFFPRLESMPTAEK